MEVIIIHKTDVVKHKATKAILLGFIKKRMEFNRSKNRNFYLGCYWTGHITLEEIADATGIPYSTVKRNIGELVQDFVIVKGNFNKKSYDHTGWYTLPKPDSVRSSFDSFSPKEKLEADLNASKLILESKVKDLKAFFRGDELIEVIRKPEFYISNFKEWEKPFEVLSSFILYKKEIAEIEKEIELCEM